MRDSGLAHALLGLGTHADLLPHPVVGGSWEGWVIENLIASAPNASRGYHIACDDVGATRRLVVSSSAVRFPMAGGIEHVPLLELMHELLTLHRVPV